MENKKILWALLLIVCLATNIAKEDWLNLSFFIIIFGIFIHELTIEADKRNKELLKEIAEFNKREEEVNKNYLKDN